ncbi:PH domain-containing protein [Microbacterium horticulturae]|uniref:PH domain-containing protein n=1 Tax=Microbacterium horticulturae TaxID=3028316 RepID=A0ABY8BYN5_9MICO|nr:PH domain-containing protein [Microbacterium sp. KACC 23027]WEG07533.1 PH domain-containing protein [Microbacterium sp. KACC 23027]
MTKDLAEGGTVVLRAVMSTVVFWVVVVVAAFFVSDALIRGRWSTGLRAVGVLLFVLWALWVFLYRMSIVVDQHAVTARNLLRDTRIPWGLIADFDRRYQVRVILHDGTAVDCWGSPFPQRTVSNRSQGSRRPGTGTDVEWKGVTSEAPHTIRSSPAQGPDPTVELLRALGASAAPGPSGEVRRGWDTPALLIGAACAVCALIAVLV